MSATASRIERVVGRVIAVHGDDMDTDRIIPARFLKAVTFEGLEGHLFEDDRAALRTAGQTHPFDNPKYQGASILLANDNFGCGSSREHAPQAILRWGIRAVIAESFAEIFFGNSLMIGLACLTAAHDDIERLMSLAESAPETNFAVDIREKTLVVGDLQVKLELPSAVQEALVSGGWDATGLLLDRYEEVEATGRRLPYPGFEQALGTRH